MKSSLRIMRVVLFSILLAVSLTACGGGGGSSSGTTTTGIPSAPTGVTASAGNGQVTISWSAVSGATSYNIYWSTTSGVTKTNGTKIPGATSPYSHTGLTNGTTYYYIVTAVNSSGESVESAQVSATPTATSTTKVPIAEWSIVGAPWGVAVDSGSNVYVAALFGNRIDKFSSTGTFITQWGSGGSGNSQFNGPKYIAVDGSNNLYVADNMNHRVQKFSSSGTYITQWGSYGTGNGQFNGPTGIAVDIVGAVVYVVDSNNSRIQKFDLSGGYITQWGSFGTGNGQFEFEDFVGGHQGPEGGIAVDSTGAVYVVDNWNHRIQKFTSTGIYIAQWGSNGSGNGQFLFPSGIAVDSTGAVYVVDNSTSGNQTGNVGRIEKFDSSGNYITQWVLTYSNGLPANGIGVATDSTGAVYVTQGESIDKYAP